MRRAHSLPLVLTVLALLLTPPPASAQAGTVEVPSYPAEVALAAKQQVERYQESLNPYRNNAGMAPVLALADRAESSAQAGRVVPALAFLKAAQGAFQAESALEATKNMSESGRRAYLLTIYDNLVRGSAGDLDDARRTLAHAEDNLTSLKGFEAALHAGHWLGLAAHDVNSALLQYDEMYAAQSVDPALYRLALRNAASGKTYSAFALTLLGQAATHDRNDPNALNLTAVDRWVQTARNLGAVAPDTGAPFPLTKLKSINASAERLFALNLVFMNTADAKARDLALKYNPVRRNSEDSARGTLETEVRQMYSAFPLLNISDKWGYTGLTALHGYDTAAAILEEPTTTFDDLVKAAAALHESSEMLRTLLAQASPLAEADLAASRAKAADTPAPSETSWFVPGPGPMLAAVAVGVAAVSLAVARRWH